MRGIAHLAFGLLIASIADLLLTFPSFLHTMLFYFACAFASLLPDLDYNAKLFLVHRGSLHSIWFVVIVLLVSFIVYPFLLLPLLLGISSHLALDSTTRSGIKLFHPFGKKSRGKLKTGSFKEKIFLGIVAIIDVILALYNF
ncbi:MAG: metal-dependent hydrolase [Nanoarchaeota archaeon]|nr:metal-dependent hydrolase [Nanoarchaeota archaeon]